MPRRSNRVMYREAVGLPATLRPGRAVVALCHWEDFNRDALDKPGAPLWRPRDEPPAACRASLGDERLTVWLPQGARIHLRGVLWYRERNRDPMGGEFVHVYGTHERMTRTRIRITLTEYPHA